MKKTLKKFANKEIKNTKVVKGGNKGIDDLIKNLGGATDLKKMAGI